jgi:hypothetical protein
VSAVALTIAIATACEVLQECGAAIKVLDHC